MSKNKNNVLCSNIHASGMRGFTLFNVTHEQFTQSQRI